MKILFFISLYLVNFQTKVLGELIKPPSLPLENSIETTDEQSLSSENSLKQNNPTKIEISIPSKKKPVSYFEKVKNFFGMTKNVPVKDNLSNNSKSSEDIDFIELGNNKLSNFSQLENSTYHDDSADSSATTSSIPVNIPISSNTDSKPEYIPVSNEAKIAQDLSLNSKEKSSQVNQNTLNSDESFNIKSINQLTTNETAEEIKQSNDIKLRASNIDSGFINEIDSNKIKNNTDEKVVDMQLQPHIVDKLIVTQAVNSNVNEVPQMPEVTINSNKIIDDNRNNIDISMKKNIDSNIAFEKENSLNDKLDANNHNIQSLQTPKKLLKVNEESSNQHDQKIDDSNNDEKLGQTIDSMSFVENETKVLLLPNDDVVLGNLSQETADLLKPAHEYIEIFNEKYERELKSDDHDRIVRYINNHDKNIFSSQISDEYISYAEDSIKRNDIAALKVIINNHNIQKFISNDTGNNLIHNAVESNNWTLTKFLIMKGANINMVNYLGDTAIEIANSKREVSLSKLLRRAGAKWTSE